MAIFGQDEATPTTPKGQFAARYARGMGVAHRAYYNTGQPALFANTPLEVMNRREFVCFWQDFITNLDSSTAQGAAGEPGKVWEMTALGGATPAFYILTDGPNGLGWLSSGGTTAGHGVQIQLFPNSLTAAGEIVSPYTQPVIAWAACGKIPLAHESSWFVGLCKDDTAILAVGGAMSATSYIGFHHPEGDDNVYLVQRGGAADVVVDPLTTLWTPEDGESPLVLRELGIRIEDNDKMKWYLNGICIGATEVGNVENGNTVAAFVGNMTPSFVIVNQTGGAASGVNSLYIDYHTLQATRVLAPIADVL